jgi:HEAT repeat protein
MRAHDSRHPTIRSASLLVLALFLLAAPAAAREQQTSDVSRDTLGIAGLSPEELFLRASSSALQFQPMIEPSRARLVEEHESSLPYLLSQLDTDDPRERIALEDILVRIGAPAVAPLIEAFEREAARHDTTRGARLAASVLGRLGDAAAVGPLAAARHHPDWKVRGAVAGSLGRIDTEEALPALVDLLADANEIVRKSAAFGIGGVASSMREECGCDSPPSSVEWDAAIRALAAAMEDSYYAVRYNAADALAKVGPEAVPLLKEELRSDRGFGLLMALRAVGDIGSDEALPYVSDLLSSEKWTVRGYAVEAFALLESSEQVRRELTSMRKKETHPFVLYMIDRVLSEM